jgi:hypothetical protein
MVVAYVMMKVEPKKMEEVFTKVQTFRQVIDATLIYGEYDVIVKIKEDSIEALNNFIFSTLRTMPGVKETNTIMGLVIPEKRGLLPAAALRWVVISDKPEAADDLAKHLKENLEKSTRGRCEVKIVIDPVYRDLINIEIKSLQAHLEECDLCSAAEIIRECEKKGIRQIYGPLER